MKIHYAFCSLLVLAFPTPPYAQEVEHRLGEHPAVIVKRLEASQGYDYQSKFYPHPAWLYLEADAPHPMGEHPAVLVARRAAQAEPHPVQQAPQVTAPSRPQTADVAVR